MIMKKIFLFLALLPAMLVAQERMMVFTDPHVLASSLMDTTSLSFGEMLNGQRKMIHLSEPAFMALVDTALAYHPAVVLIPGDLTKDSEWASHQVVAAQLNRLEQAGIKALVIPGNHDIGGNAYAYTGAEKTQVANLTNSDWETMYASVYAHTVAKDPDSHSYVAEPIEGLTVLAIDGANNTAAMGVLSSRTQKWVLAQADSAVAKGNTIIAMSHWQILEHFDAQGTLESACRFQKADALRDSLMRHGVHMVLTGHFHVNGITTFRDTTGLTNDSIVEITSGAPITYPCPYRWLTLSADRETVSVTTDYLNSLPGYPQLEAYSREWMRIHTANMLPRLAVEMWDTGVETARTKISSIPGSFFLGLDDAFDQAVAKYNTDSAKVDLVERHLGSTVVSLYLLHSEANEPEHPEADSLAEALETNMNAMMAEAVSGTMLSLPEVLNLLTGILQIKVDPILRSLVEDITGYGQTYADRTDDLRLSLHINSPRQHEAIDEITNHQSPITNKVIKDGVLYILRGGKTYTAEGTEVQ